MKFEVMKIGGAVLSSPQNLIYLKKIVENYCKGETIFVFSAFKNFSRILKELAFFARNGRYEESKSQLNQFRDQILNYAKVLENDSRLFYDTITEIDSLLGEIEKIIFGIAVTKELSKRTLDRFLAFGEIITMSILEAYLKSQNVDSVFVDSRKVIFTNDDFGKAKPLEDLTKEAVQEFILPLFHRFKIVFVPGFVGRTRDGLTTTMGFESSNLTALLIASIVEAKKVCFWTDVEGIRTSDPKIVENTNYIPELSFDFAKVLALNGLKLIHPYMIEFFYKNPEVEYVYRSAFAPDIEMTRIVPETKRLPKIILISEPTSFIFENVGLDENSSNDFLLAQRSPDCSFVINSKFISDNSSKSTKLVSLLTFLNFETKEVVMALSEIVDKILFFQVVNVNNVAKLILEEGFVVEVANKVHNILID
ncbi:MAG: hypothetical protein N2517_03735 [Ignavibacteria bacterium]|nr:hypothetical protein [Ignavibacteria bacterium]